MERKVSVAMATYNGEKYIKEQISSILDNLREFDEIVISDDGSKDRTIDIIKEFNDPRIHIFNGPKKGVKKNFENAIRHCDGELIFLCDQDDIWMPDKVEKVLSTYVVEECNVIVHNCVVTDDDGGILVDSFFDFKKSGPGAFKNYVRNTYIGCCMAFSSSLKDIILPIPDDIEMHDQWIGIIGDKLGKNIFMDDKLINYRRHESNASDMFHHYGIIKMITNRVNLLKRLIERRVL